MVSLPPHVAVAVELVAEAGPWPVVVAQVEVALVVEEVPFVTPAVAHVLRAVEAAGLLLEAGRDQPLGRQPDPPPRPHAAVV